MKLGMQAGLGPGHIVLDRDPAPTPQRVAEPPIFGPYLLRLNGCRDQGATWYGGRTRPRRLCVRWGHCSPSPKRGGVPKFSAHAYCGQTAGWIKMVLGMEVGLSPGDFVLDGAQPPPQKGAEPPVFGHVYCGQTAAWIKMPLGTAVGLGLSDIVLDGSQLPLPYRGTSPNFCPLSIVAKWLDGLRCDLVWA